MIIRSNDYTLQWLYLMIMRPNDYMFQWLSVPMIIPNNGRALQWSGWLPARNMGLRWLCLPSAAVQDSTSAEDWTEQTETPNPKLSCPTLTIYPFSCGANFYWLGCTNPPQSTPYTIPLPSSKFYFSMHQLIFLMSGQCTYPSLSLPCLNYHRLYIKSEYSYRCSSCKFWMHQKCSGLAFSSFHHNYDSAPDARHFPPLPIRGNRQSSFSLTLFNSSPYG